MKCKSSAIEFIRIAEAQPSLAVELVFDGKVTVVGEMRQSALTPQNPVAQKLIFPFYFAVSKELLTFAALISLLTLNCIRMKQEKARNCVKSCKMFASVESFSYFCR